MGTKIIQNFTRNSQQILKRALNRKAPQIAENFRVLGKPVSDRFIRKMCEPNADVVRRNPLDQILILLGAAFMESPKRFKTIWDYLELFKASLVGKVYPGRDIEDAFAEFRFRSAAAEKAFIDRQFEKFDELLIYVDEALKNLRRWRLQIV